MIGVIAFDSDRWIYAFKSVEEASGSLEAIDVEAGEYLAFANDGSPLAIEADARGSLVIGPAGPPDEDRLRQLLRQALSQRGIQPPDDANPFRLYVDTALERFKEWERSRSLRSRLRRG